MKHEINEKVINITWDRGDLIEMHDSGCADYQVSGEDEKGNIYCGDGNYQNGELIDVIGIEKIWA